MFTRKISARNDSATVLNVEKTRNKEIILSGIVNVMGVEIDFETVTFEEDFRDLTIKDGEKIELFGQIKSVARQGDVLTYSFRPLALAGFKLEIDRDKLADALSKPWYWPF